MLPYFKFHHIGIATNSIDNTSKYYINAGYSASAVVLDPIQNVNICFLSKEEMPTVELLEPVDEKSPVFKIVKSTGVTPYHCCYLVVNIEEAIVELRRLGFVPLSKPVPAIALGGRSICFMYSRSVGLIELLNE